VHTLASGQVFVARITYPLRIHHDFSSILLYSPIHPREADSGILVSMGNIRPQDERRQLIFFLFLPQNDPRTHLPQYFESWLANTQVPEQAVFTLLAYRSKLLLKIRCRCSFVFDGRTPTKKPVHGLAEMVSRKGKGQPRSGCPWAGEEHPHFFLRHASFPI